MKIPRSSVVAAAARAARPPDHTPAQGVGTMLRRKTSLLALGLLSGLVLVVGLAAAASPPSSTVTVASTVGQTVTVTWSGTIPPLANASSDCAALANTSAVDRHEATVNVPAGLYNTLDAQFTFSISWTPAVDISLSDEILTVIDPDGNELGSSDGGSPSETVSGTNLAAGTYKVVACGFANAQPQNYTGTLTIRTVAREASLPSAPAQGLEFSASVPADNQRDESEPLMEIDGDGNMYTCGPTGFSNAADYAQVSTDGGDQFHLLGTPPRGQQGAGGGGDCSLATGVARNGQGRFQYAYSGLGPLTGFVSSTSPDNGHSLTTGGPQSAGITTQGGGADRQWNVFLDAQTVLIIYNQQAPRNVVVQRSTDGGLTYSPVAVVAAPNPQFPGPIRYDAAHDVVFFAWDKKGSGADTGEIFINLSVSLDKGQTWTTCRAATAPVDTAGFVTADNDRDGNIYLAYTEAQRYHTYMTALKAADVSKCNTPTSVALPTNNPGFSTPVQVDRNNVRSTVFSWLTAGPEPGRIAVAFYGTESDGDPNVGTFDASWDVYVNQSLNALAPDATFSQVKATTHPFHYDSICLNGLGCDLAVPPGDRSLADFFAIDYNPVTKKLSVVFNRTNKKPDEATGHIASPMAATQISGPSNGGGTLPAPTRPVVRTSSSDPIGDAQSSYSTLFPLTASPTNEPAGDFLSASVGPEIDLVDGSTIKDGGFTLTMKLADLSDTALQNTMLHTQSQSLLWVFRFTNGHHDTAAAARWNPVQGFTFGYNDYTTGATPCAAAGPGSSASEKCVLYPGDQPIQGDVNQATGTIRLSVPRFLLRALSGPTGNGQRPVEEPAAVGSRFYDATAFSLGNTLSPLQTLQTFLYPLDNTPAMDFLLPGASTPPPSGAACKVAGGGAISTGSGEGKFTLNAHANLKGNISYRDNGADIDMTATQITSVTCNDVGHSATVKGLGQNKTDASPKPFQIDVVDNGDSGKNDVFEIQFGSYGKSGKLIRGNLQIH